MKVIREVVWAVVLAIAVAAVMFRHANAAGGSCESLLTFKAENTAVDLAEVVPPGGFQPNGAAPNAQNASRFAALQAFCRVAATIKPTTDSEIKIEVWMPASGWNGKFEAVGNGGWGGTISYSAMAQALTRGYATTSTDTGHSTPGASFAFGHPEKLIDYAYRSEHEMTVTAKAIVGAFYGRVPARSYFDGCSTGGRQALTEASRFPDDFDGIIAGAAANPKTHLDTWRIWMVETLKDPDTRIPKEKYLAIHQAVLAACDMVDGLKDGLIDDPTKCHFDPQVIACRGGDEPGCLTPTQVRSVRTVLSPLKSPRTGAEIFPGFQPGSELQWDRLIGGPDPYDTAIDQFRYVVFNNPQWDWRTFDVDRDLAAADQAVEGLLTSIDPGSMGAFFGRGGKLLTYHGWADQDIASLASVNFYKSVIAAVGDEQVSHSMRLFMIPGMGHCGGGDGPNTFEMMPALEQWVEQGQAPARVVASHSTNSRVDRTRPLCPYPQVARHTGSGSADDAQNFACRLP